MSPEEKIKLLQQEYEGLNKEALVDTILVEQGLMTPEQHLHSANERRMKREELEVQAYHLLSNLRQGVEKCTS